MKALNIIVSIVAIMTVAGCSTPPKNAAPNVAVNNSANTAPPIAASTLPAKGMPVWIEKTESVDAFVAVGSAQPNPLGDRSFQRQTATANARVELAGRMTIRVQNMFRNLLQQNTTASTDGKQRVRNDVANRMTESVSRLLINQELAGSNIRETWTDPDDGTLYVLVGISKETTDQALQQLAKSQIQSAIKSGIQGLDQATDKLDAAIASTKNAPVAGDSQ